MDFLKELYAMGEGEYADFQAKLTPGIPRENFIGVRIPKIRALAKQKKDDPQVDNFLSSLPHEFYEENILHGCFLSQSKDFESCIQLVDAFLPYVDNWAVCDTMNPKVFAKHKKECLTYAKRWMQSKEVYTCRFGILTLMRYFLDEDYKKEYLDKVASISSEEYYIQMMIAWFFATALAKQWDETILFLEQKRLAPWVHKKTIQKAKESFRITAEQKAYLEGLKA
ncbi:MAG: DNA alkylation repair protein [Clostridia bacterium]|nr:DNA alkylation repair protein [Clostridia bacterium]